MAWGKSASTTLTTTADEVDSGTITATKFVFVLGHIVASGNPDMLMRFNGDTGTNYAHRVSLSGGSDLTGTSEPNAQFGSDNGDFGISYIVNIGTEEKLYIGNAIDGLANGAGNAPERREIVGKWVNTTDQITSVKIRNSTAGDYLTDTNITVLGTD